jgi:Uma2 family endonuclease
MMNSAISHTLADRLADLGNVPLERIRQDPPPGQATIDDVNRLRESEGKLYELVDSTLVEKAMGWQESMLAGVLLQWLNNYLDENPIGVATGADGMTRLFADTVRGPDVAFVSWSRLPDGRLPEQPIPDLVPNFVIEVLSISNTRAEMSRKRREFFHAGVELIWMIDPRSRTVAVFESSEKLTMFDEFGVLSGGNVLPGWSVDLEKLFARLDQSRP